MKRRYVYDRLGNPVEVENRLYVVKPFEILRDISPYRSMVTGEIISSRSRHREHLKEHNLLEVGNEVNYMVKNIRRPEPPPGLHDAIMRAAVKHGVFKP